MSVAESQAAAPSPRRYFYKRHSLVVRITHWVNLLCMTVLLMSGLQIFNAHPALYWGKISTFEDPALALRAVRKPDGTMGGVTTIGDFSFDTTGVLGASKAPNGSLSARGFPAWSTLPSARDLATGRRWHFFFAWLFVINGLAYVAWTLATRHRRQFWPTREQWRDFGGSLREHLLLRFPKGEEARTYNVLQKITYFLVIFVLVPLLILAGLTMSPGMNAKVPWLLDLFGGRQSARTIHFVAAALILAFVFVHVFMVIASGVWNNMRSMVSGRFRIDNTESPHAAE